MVTISQSRIKLWRRCQQAYYYREVEELERKHKPLALEKGSLMHLLAETFFSKKGNWQTVLDEYRKKFEKLMEEEKDLYGDLPAEAERLFKGYLKKWYPNNAIKEKILAVELNFAETPVEIVPGVFLRGIIDRILKITEGALKGKIVLCEMKNVTKIPSEEERFYDVQTCLYVFAAIKLGFKVDLIMWDYVRTKPPTIPKALKKGGITRRQNLDTDYETYHQVIVENGFDPKDYPVELERAKLNVYYDRRFMPISDKLIKMIFRDFIRTAKEIDALKMYPTRNLGFNCRGCEYVSLCRAELMGLDADFIRRTEYQPGVKKGGVLEIEEKSENEEGGDI